MIDDKTIKSLYDDKPTLLEWLKRVEEQLEELKRITNFDALTANNLEVNDKLIVKGNPVAKAIYLHKLTFNIGGTILEKAYLSANPNPYSSLADVFEHASENTMGHNEIFTYRHGATYYPVLYFFNIGSNGVVQNGFSINYENLQLQAVPNSDITSMVITDRVLGGWVA